MIGVFENRSVQVGRGGTFVFFVAECMLDISPSSSLGVSWIVLGNGLSENYKCCVVLDEFEF